MELSTFLAKLIGLYLLALALIALLRKEQFQSAVSSIISSRGLYALTGMINLGLGLAILIGHPYWELNWRGLISLLGALAVVQGFLRIAFTTQLQNAFPPSKVENYYWIIVGILIVLGAFLTYSGFHFQA